MHNIYFKLGAVTSSNSQVLQTEEVEKCRLSESQLTSKDKVVLQCFECNLQQKKQWDTTTQATK